MSTRANILIRSGQEKLWFYRHSDGYPDGVAPTLKKMLQWVKEGVIRDNVSQASGWLVLLGAMEYKTVPPSAFEKKETFDYEIHLDKPKDWKCGAYEPTTGKHCDIEWKYVFDLEQRTIKVYETVPFEDGSARLYETWE